MFSFQVSHKYCTLLYDFPVCIGQFVSQIIYSWCYKFVIGLVKLRSIQRRFGSRKGVMELSHNNLVCFKMNQLTQSAGQELSCMYLNKNQ